MACNPAAHHDQAGWLVLDRLACMARGADTHRLDFAAQSAGLLAFSLGRSQLQAADHAILAAAMPLETHSSILSTMTGATK